MKGLVRPIILSVLSQRPVGKIRCIINRTILILQFRMNNNFYGSLSQSEKDIVMDYVRELFAITISHINNNQTNTYADDRI